MTARNAATGVLSAVGVVLLVVGCGGGDTGGDAGAAPGASGAPTAMPFDEATAGHVRGVIRFEGTAPAAAPIDMSSEPSCAQQHSTPPTAAGVRVQDGGLGEAFVYVREGLEGMTFPTPSAAAVIDQQGCRYHPHITGVQAGQSITFRNSDGLLHNINATPAVNRPFNISQPVNMETSRSFASPEVMIPIRCDVHGWMLAYVGVLSHPYHAVSGDAGAFELRGLPPGDYVIEAWHSRMGTVEQSVTVATGQTAEITLTFNEGMLTDAVVPMGEPIYLGFGLPSPGDHGAHAAAPSHAPEVPSPN